MSKIILKECYQRHKDDIEDRRLRNWNRWLESRKKTCNRLKNLTGRKSEDLVINSYEKIRPKIAIQNLIEAASMSEVSEDYKNNLNFWTTPVYLKNRRDPDNPELAASLTRKQLKIPRIISRVFLPELIQEEKLLHLPEAPIIPHQHNEYLRKRLKELSPQISKMNLKTCGIQQVAIKGKKIPEKEEIIVKFQNKQIIFDEDSIYCVSSRELEPRIISLDFFSTKEETAEERIYIENRTLLKITYKWQEIVCHPSVLSKIQGPKCFYFGKNSDTILPGRCDNLIVWYHSTSSGAHLASMKFDTDPKISQSVIIFNFWGVCEQPHGFIDEIINYDDYLNIRLRNCVVKEIIEGIWEKIELSAPKLPPYACYFRESEVFVVKNQYLFYHYEVVEELKEIYRMISKKDPWAISILEFQTYLLALNDENFRNEILRKFMDLCQKLLKPITEELFIHTKLEAVYNLLCGFVSKFSTESELIKLHCLWDQLELETIEQSLSRSNSALSEFDSTRSIEMRENWRRNDQQQKQYCYYGSTSSLGSEFEEFYRNTTTEIIYDIGLYSEILYVRIYDLLGSTIEGICAVLESMNNLN